MAQVFEVVIYTASLSKVSQLCTPWYIIAFVFVSSMLIHWWIWWIRMGGRRVVCFASTALSSMGFSWRIWPSWADQWRMLSSLTTLQRLIHCSLNVACQSSRGTMIRTTERFTNIFQCSSSWVKSVTCEKESQVSSEITLSRSLTQWKSLQKSRRESKLKNATELKKSEREKNIWYKCKTRIKRSNSFYLITRSQKPMGS